MIIFQGNFPLSTYRSFIFVNIVSINLYPEETVMQ